MKWLFGDEVEVEKERRMVRQEAALPMSCHIVAEVNTLRMLYPQPVRRAGYK
jgi:hypothetical protein